LTLPGHRSGKVIHFAEPGEGGGFRLGSGTASLLLFRGQIGEVIG
jgi:hypothetical protein